MSFCAKGPRCERRRRERHRESRRGWSRSSIAHRSGCDCDGWRRSPQLRELLPRSPSRRRFAPLDRCHVRSRCAAMAITSAGGQPGKSSRMAPATRAAKSWSCPLRHTSFRSRRAARWSASARHSCSAFCSADSSTKIPWRSYRSRARLKRTTTAARALYFLARRVSAASPRARQTR